MRPGRESAPVCAFADEVPQRRLGRRAGRPFRRGVDTEKTFHGRYLIESTVDEGGNAIVYSARHLQLGKRVALRVLSPAMACRKEVAGPFLEQAKLASAITSSHVARFSDFGETPEGGIYLVMDWLEGDPLSSLIGAAVPPSLDRVLAVLQQVARCLATAHGHGIVHGRLAAGRVFLVRRAHEEDFVKILGFGTLADPAGTGVSRDIHDFGLLLLEAASGAKIDLSIAPLIVSEASEAEWPSIVKASLKTLPIELRAIVLKALNCGQGRPAYRRIEDVSADLARFRAGQMPDALLEKIASSTWVLVPRAAEGELPQALLRSAPRPPEPAPVTPETSWKTYALILAVLVVSGLAAGVLFRSFTDIMARFEAPAPHDFATMNAPSSKRWPLMRASTAWRPRFGLRVV